MTRVLLTGKTSKLLKPSNSRAPLTESSGGSGFIAAHVLSALRKHGHSVVTTVRSKEKADKTKAGYPNDGPDKLDFAIVEDIGKEGGRHPFFLSSREVQTETSSFRQGGNLRSAIRGSHPYGQPIPS